MGDETAVVRQLDEPESLRLLGTQQLGRLVTRVREVIDIFPVNYVLDGGDLVFRTAEGTKLIELTINERVVFEADHVGDDRAWSVVVHGTAEPIETSADIEHAESLGLRPWIPTLKTRYVRVRPESITGRTFLLGAEPSQEL